MGERNRDGDLRAEYLRAGQVEQYAVIRGGKHIIVELRASHSEALPWLVTHRILDPAAQESSCADHCYEHLDDARRHFRTLIRKNP